MRWAKKVHSVGKGMNEYAAHSDFCAVFIQQTDRLYSLALILTGDELRAEQCLLVALDSCAGNLVFKESAVSWSSRAVIKTAIRSMSPAPFGLARRSLLGNLSNANFETDVSIECVQELLNLGPESRMNVPGQASGNWSWRCREDMLYLSAFEWLQELTQTSRRSRPPSTDLHMTLEADISARSVHHRPRKVDPELTRPQPADW